VKAFLLTPFYLLALELCNLWLIPASFGYMLGICSSRVIVWPGCCL